MDIQKLINEIKTIQTFSEVKNILLKYKGDDWKKYVKINNEIYHKEKIFENDKLDIYILTWDINQESKIHDHAKNGCWLKMLQGNLKENIYDENLKFLFQKNLNENDIGFMHNNMGYHNIQNNENKIAVSLHVYSPPNHFTKYY